MMMIKASRKDECGAPTSTGASPLDACRPLVVIQNPEKVINGYFCSKIQIHQLMNNQLKTFVTTFIHSVIILITFAFDIKKKGNAV